MSHNSASEQGPFDANKAIAAIALLVQETGASMYSVMKMLYLADKAHLEQHGRFITGDSYVAMKQGPVPSCAYNMIKHARGEEKRREGDEVALQFLSCDATTHVITIKRMPALDELSESDVECLKAVSEAYHRLGKWAVKDMSHDDAWKKAWKPDSAFAAFRSRRTVPMPIEAIAAEVDESGALLAHLRDQHPGSAESR